MKWGACCLFVILLCFSMPHSVNGGWHFVAPMPHGRYGHGATLGPDGKIYVMGGMVFEVTEKRMLYKKYNDGRYSSLVYDPEKDKWEYLEPVPGWIDAHYLYFFESDAGRWRRMRRVKAEENCFEIDEGMGGPKRYLRDIRPEQLRATDIDRQGNGAALVTGKDGTIYFLGGKGRWIDFGEAIVLPYDPLSSTWPDVRPKRHYSTSTSYRIKTIYETDVPPMIDRRIDHEAVVTSDGKICVMGGYQRDRYEDDMGNVTGGTRYDVLDTVECYDPKTKKWQYTKPLSTKRMLFAAVVGPDDKIYVFGGAAGLSTESSTPILDTTELFDPETDTWSRRTPMPAPRSGHVGVLGADEKIYIMGGSSFVDGPPLNSVFVYDPAKNTWKEGPSMKRPRDTLAAVSTPGGKIYAIGGTDVGAYEKKETLNLFLRRKHELYTGKVQDTVEVLDIREHEKKKHGWF
ncbi:MAG: kelch repeat-containing protein [Thermodesulfobacteriota bacterium]|nr:kelch repeat-containing protein [Thermodesulfobacteriota bacterium]